MAGVGGVVAFFGMSAYSYIFARFVFVRLFVATDYVMNSEGGFMLFVFLSSAGVAVWGLGVSEISLHIVHKVDPYYVPIRKCFRKNAISGTRPQSPNKLKIIGEE